MRPRRRTSMMNEWKHTLFYCNKFWRTNTCLPLSDRCAKDIRHVSTRFFNRYWLMIKETSVRVVNREYARWSVDHRLLDSIPRTNLTWQWNLGNGHGQWIKWHGYVRLAWLFHQSPKITKSMSCVVPSIVGSILSSSVLHTQWLTNEGASQDVDDGWWTNEKCCIIHLRLNNYHETFSTFAFQCHVHCDSWHSLYYCVRSNIIKRIHSLWLVRYQSG